MKKSTIKKSLSLVVVFLAITSLMSCIAAIPVAVMYYKEANKTKATAEMPVPPDKVYSTAVSMAQEKGLQIVKKEDEKRYIEVTDGVQTGSLRAVPMENGNTEVTVVAAVPSEEEKEKRKEQEKELTLRIINRICERLEVKCTITKQKE